LRSETRANSHADPLFGLEVSDRMYGMWPFSSRRKDEQKSDRFIKRMVAGIIIGGAIGSVIGKKLMEKQEEKDPFDEEGED